jgi:hypothetical protein
MLSVPATVPIILSGEATEMGVRIDGLPGIVRSQISDDPLDGSLYLFVNRRAGSCRSCVGHEPIRR